MFYLLQNKKYLENLKDELRSAFVDMDDMSLESLARLPILDATIKEGLRMFPPVPIGLSRVSPPGGMMVGEHFVPQGTKLAVHQLSTYRQDSNFSRSNEFKPERWMGDSKFADDSLDAFEPFSTGPRNCLGKVQYSEPSSQLTRADNFVRTLPGTRCAFSLPRFCSILMVSCARNLVIGQISRFSRCGRSLR